MATPDLSQRTKAKHGVIWMTEYVRSSSTSKPSKQEHVLGVDFGDDYSTDRQFQQATDTVSELHEALAQLDDTASELIC